MTFELEGGVVTAAQEPADAQAVIGPLLAVCGTNGPHAEDLQVAIELGLRDDNASARIVYYNDQRSGRRAQEVASEIAASGTKYVVGHFSTPAALAASRIYNDQGILFLAPGTSASDLCASDSTTTLQLFGTDDEQLECLERAALERGRSILLLSQTGTYGARLAASLVLRLSPCCQKLSALYLNERPPSRLPVAVEANDVLVILGPHDFAARLFSGALSAVELGEVLMSDDCFTPSLFREEDLASRCSVAFLEKQSGILVDRQIAELRHQARRLLGRSAGPYFETSYLAARALALAWRDVGPDEPSAVLRYILRHAWQSPFGLLSFSDERRLKGHRWKMIPARAIAER